jgi:hypothetical protein
VVKISGSIGRTRPTPAQPGRPVWGRRGGGGLSRIILAGAWGLLAWLGYHPREAAAHPHELVPTLVNRYITLTVFDSRVDVLVSLLFGQLPAGERRRQMDLDGNARIDARELSRERLWWGQAADRLVLLAVDGSPVTLTAGSAVDLSGETAVVAKPILVELNGSFDLSPGQRRLTVAAGSEVPRLGETEVALEIAEGWTLVASTDPQGHTTPTLQRVFHFPAPTAAGLASPSVTFLLRAHPGGRSGPALWQWGLAGWVLIAIALGATGTLVWVAFRARRRRDQAV